MAKQGAVGKGLEHRAEKWAPVFRTSDAATKNIIPRVRLLQDRQADRAGRSPR